MTSTRLRPVVLGVVVLALALFSVLWQARPAFASTVTVLGTNAPPGATFTFTAGPGIPPTFGGVVNSTEYILAPGAYTVVWNPVSDARGACTITPSSTNFTVTSSSTNVIDRPTAVYSCPASIPPDTSITGQPTNPANTGSAVFSFTGTDNVTAPTDLTFQCALDGAAFTGCTEPQTYTGLADGSHTFQVRARDEDGNVDPTPASYTWVVQTDTVPPETTITAQPPDPTNQTGASFSFTGTDNLGVAGFQCSLDGTAFSACTSPQTYTSLSQGSHTFQVRAKDAGGTVDPTPASYTWTVDTTAPTVTVPANITADATSNAGAVVTFTASATDTDPENPAVSCTPASGSTFAIATTTVNCSATDAAGNTGTNSFTVTVRGAAEQLTTLVGSVRAVGPGTSLLSKAQAAQAALAAGNVTDACGFLGAMINEARAQSGQRLTVTQARQIIADATRIRAVLACR
jgi:hypothetical protein